MAKAKPAFDFQSSLNQLEKIVEALESGELSLEDSIKQFESGMKISQKCQTYLDQAESKVQKLVGVDEELDQPMFESFDDEEDEEDEPF